MKILSVNHTSDLYGASRCLERIASRLAGEGHELTVVIRQPGPLQEAMERIGVRVLLHPWLPVAERGVLQNFRDRLRLLLGLIVSPVWLAWVIVKHRIDIVHTNSAVIFTSAFAARITGRPHIWHIREFFLEFPKLWSRYEHLIHRLSLKVIAISIAVKEQFSLDCQSKIEIIYDGLPRAEFHPSVVDEAAREFRKSFGLTGRPLAGVVGRLKWVRKGQEVLIRAAAILRDKYPDAMYVLVGSTAPGNEQQMDRFRALVNELDLSDRVIFTGDIDDVRPVYAALDVSVAPSVDPEPFGCVVVESMALGTPVVGSKAAGIAEQIVDGETGLLFTPGSEHELARALDRVFGDAAFRREMSERGVARFLAEFEMDRCYAEYLRVFASAVACRPGPMQLENDIVALHRK